MWKADGGLRLSASDLMRFKSCAHATTLDLRKIEVLERFEQAVAASSLAPEAAAELREHLHKLAGTAGSFGETELSAAAARGEALLVEAKADEIPSAIAASLVLLRAAA